MHVWYLVSPTASLAIGNHACRKFISSVPHLSFALGEIEDWMNEEDNKFDSKFYFWNKEQGTWLMNASQLNIAT